MKKKEVLALAKRISYHSAVGLEIGSYGSFTLPELTELVNAAIQEEIPGEEPTEKQIRAMCDVPATDGNEPRYWRDVMADQYRAAMRASKD